MYRYIQRTVESDRFYGGSIGRFDDILVVREVKLVSAFETIGRAKCGFQKPLNIFEIISSVVTKSVMMAALDNVNEERVRNQEKFVLSGLVTQRLKKLFTWTKLIQSSSVFGYSCRITGRVRPSFYSKGLKSVYSEGQF